MPDTVLAELSSDSGRCNGNVQGDCAPKNPIILNRHPVLWFPDGSMVLKAEQTLFRVHASQLARHSVVFRDMFSMPQPVSPERPASTPTDAVPAECQFLQLYDPAHDLAHLLAAIYNGPVFGINDRRDFKVLSALLRLSTKYAVDKLRWSVIEHLSAAWPSTLAGWDAREEIARAYEAETGVSRRQRYPSPIAVINLARMCDAPSLLPAAFYQLSRYNFWEIFGPGRDDSSQGDESETLSPVDVQRLTLGKEASQQAVSALIRSLDTRNTREHGKYSISGFPRADPHRRSNSGQVCVSPTACRQDLLDLVKLATEHYLFDHGKGCTDPLYVAEEVGQLKSTEVNDCRACSRSLERWAAKERGKLWKQIPRWFHLDHDDITST